VLELAHDLTRWIWEDVKSLLNFFVTQKRKMLAQPVMQLRKNVAEVGRPMARGQSEKGNMINVDDAGSNDSYEHVAC
jgi:hypothetical protein